MVTDAADVRPALRYLEQRIEREQLYAAGYVSYEAAAGFGLSVRPPIAALPLLWFGLYRAPQRLALLPPTHGDYQLGRWQLPLTLPEYQQQIDRIKALLAAGVSYQMNYTLSQQTAFVGDPWRLLHVFNREPASYLAYLDLGEQVIVSASPELFFRRRGKKIWMRPMKGTAPRGRNSTEDQRAAAQLRHSSKERAENLMIVDMVRNDLGRIAELGSVRVPELFAIERYRTLLQMTSTVTAHTKAPLDQLFAALFPCASVTGAPKVETMRQLAALETSPRGVYTGAIGWIAPQRRACFAVAIRTAQIDLRQQRLIYGTGSGIVWDADAAAEYAECQLKTRVMQPTTTDFELLETLRWEPDRGYWLYQRHLKRLYASADYFHFVCRPDMVAQALLLQARNLRAAAKIRLLVNAQGDVRTQAQPLPAAATRPLRVALAQQPIDPQTPWLYHKTTRRDLYTRARAARPDCDEVLLWNPAGQVTEATTANLVVVRDGQWLTPTVDCGLLPGTFRAQLLADGLIAEAIIEREHLKHAVIFLINSVRGWQVAQLI